MEKETEKDVRKTLRDILEFVGADLEYAEYAQLQAWLEDLIKRNT